MKQWVVKGVNYCNTPALFFSFFFPVLIPLENKSFPKLVFYHPISISHLSINRLLCFYLRTSTLPFCLYHISFSVQKSAGLLIQATLKGD